MADRLLREGMRGYADEVLHRVVASYADADVQAHVHRMMTGTDPEGAAAPDEAVQAEGGDPGRQPPGTGGDG